MVPVTKTFLPPFEEYSSQIKRVFNNQWLTNRGQLVLELENKLKNYLKISNILITNNGTVPLQIAIKLLSNGGEIITTPFSYVATTAAIVWENCIPVFVDIHPQYFTIDETKIEAAISDKTTAILATHVFGNPCNVEEIKRIADKYNLKVIYDAAHAFGVEYNNNSLFSYGDVSTCSFHATKIFHTGEGGALIAHEKDLLHKLYYSHNFGHDGPLKFHGLGINAKISELQAAMGLAVFNYLDDIFNERKVVVDYYNEHLNFDYLDKITIRDNTRWNYSYYPIIFESEIILLKVVSELNKKEIFPRRYFYPSLNNLPYVERISMPVSESIAERILCLPLYHSLTFNELNEICSTINSVLC
ncbi:MAG: DegT/DnrJ/EryC1/StrS family aminotransferase [Sediminibacterium sp.]|jgi:dTDP-4-amino-4,6-dideoxygalactose transaminase|nr:DegT/DnrJ/EryC1/StrS family aminotransferase [Chitinophagaceae bacterium]MCA6447491.1 DegT/DnrJ/EryC1/StrS family aminotransferase [Chitinophagaceae bacterium]